MATQAKRTPLYDVHVALGARMIEFGGWLMPVQYTSIIEEHRAVRSRAGIFDLSHMGEIEVSGPDALSLVQWVTTNDASRLDLGQAQYSLLCRPDGGIVDDLLVYRLPDRYLLVVNAANASKDLAWIESSRSEQQAWQVQVSDRTDATALIAVQGPKAQGILQPLTDLSLEGLGYYRSAFGTVAGHPGVLVSRTGYTGEDGFELFLAAEGAVSLWKAIISAGEGAGLVPVGLGARDTLRLEACMALYGNDIDESTNPIEAGLGRWVKFDKGDFIGREALLRIQHEGPKRKLVGFRMLEPGIPRHGYEIFAGGARVGYVTSGSYSPTLDANIGLGYVPVALSEPGIRIEIGIRGRLVGAEVVPTPFYKRPRQQR
jgi:aminomethyltransferase